MLFVSADYLYVDFVILKGRPEFYVLGTMTEKCAVFGHSDKDGWNLKRFPSSFIR